MAEVKWVYRFGGSQSEGRADMKNLLTNTVERTLKANNPNTTLADDLHQDVAIRLLAAGGHDAAYAFIDDILVAGPQAAVKRVIEGRTQRPLGANKAFVAVRKKLTVPKGIVAYLNLRRILKGTPFFTIVRILAALAIGRRAKDVFRKHSHIQDALRMIVLPFEEYHAIDGARLQHCAAGFAFEDPDTGEVRTIPVCSFSLYKIDIQRKIAEKYAARADKD